VRRDGLISGVPLDDLMPHTITIYLVNFSHFRASPSRAIPECTDITSDSNRLASHGAVVMFNPSLAGDLGIRYFFVSRAVTALLSLITVMPRY